MRHDLYVGLDLVANPTLGDLATRADVSRLPFDNETFDLVLAAHVLEHVTDDQVAMREILRVLKPSGLAVLDSPVDWSMSRTDEDPSIVDPATRTARFGQEDHVRRYGCDYVDRLQQAGFAVLVAGADALTGPSDSARYALASDPLTVCRRPA